MQPAGQQISVLFLSPALVSPDTNELSSCNDIWISAAFVSSSGPYLILYQLSFQMAQTHFLKPSVRTEREACPHLHWLRMPI